MHLSRLAIKLVGLIAFSIPSVAWTDASKDEDYFEDQDQYEAYYDYVYQVNFTEFLLSDCTGDRSIAAKYYLGIRLSEAYHKLLLEVDSTEDVFSGRSLTGRLWGELVRGVRRGDSAADPEEPVGFAQRTAHEYFDEYEYEREFLCDFIWWEEFHKLGAISSELIEDAKVRYAGTQKLTKFLEAIKPPQRNFQLILDHSPLPAN